MLFECQLVMRRGRHWVPAFAGITSASSVLRTPLGPGVRRDDECFERASNDIGSGVRYRQPTRSTIFCAAAVCFPSVAIGSASALNVPIFSSAGFLRLTLLTAGHSLLPSAK